MSTSAFDVNIYMAKVPVVERNIPKNVVGVISSDDHKESHGHTSENYDKEIASEKVKKIDPSSLPCFRFGGKPCPCERPRNWTDSSLLADFESYEEPDSPIIPVHERDFDMKLFWDCYEEADPIAYDLKWDKFWASFDAPSSRTQKLGV